MGHQNQLVVILGTFLHLLVFAHNEPASDKCDYSQEHHIVTCLHLNLKTSDFGSLIKPDTELLIIKETSHLEIPSNYHSNENFQYISSYQIVNNGVVEIDSFGFSKLDKLRYLKISNNQRWATLQSNTFFGLSRLDRLSIVNNSMERIEDQAFIGLSNLDVLEMKNNKLKVIPALAFKPLHSLTSLFLYGNNIETLEDGCFAGMSEIELLDITHNKLKIMKTSTFNGLTKLADLYLSFNEIDIIEGDFALPSLKFLYLQHNKLISISPTIFKDAANLKAVDLSFNKLSIIADNTFSNLKSLDLLDLSNNNATLFVNFGELSNVLVIT